MEPTMNEKKEADPQTVKKNWPQRILHILLPLVIIGAGYWRKGKKIYERENKIHQ